MIQAFRNELFHKYMFVSKKTANRTHEKLEAIGLYRGQPVLLHLLWEKDGLSGRELSQLMEVQPATVTKMVRRLKASGFVTTMQDKKDSRVSRVYLSDLGRSVEGEVKAVFVELQETIFRGLSPDEIKLFHGLLDQMKDNLKLATEEERAHENE